ncbi:MAG: signal peptidase I [Lachnospiraceae bacterium]|jgi:signal peptidase I|nr:signal peptidase I [Lachnospiraceae bacterium]
MGQLKKRERKKEKPEETLSIPPIEMLEKELKREQNKLAQRKGLVKTVGILLVVAAVAVLILTFLFPVVQVYGDSMQTTLYENDVIIALKTPDINRGDVIAFWYKNKILVKRVVAMPGEWIDIDKEGNVYIDDDLLEEPYVQQTAFGECNITLPYQVPEGRLFVIGDNRGVSVDSRSSLVGCVAAEQIIGKMVFRIWPLEKIGTF